MPVMSIRHVRVIVHERRVAMGMAVWLAGWLAGQMLVLMMLVMLVEVFVGELVVLVLVAVALAEKKADSDRHHQHGEPVVPAQRVAQEKHGREGAYEGSRREVRCLPRSADQAKREGVEDDAHTIAEAPEHERAEDEAPRWKGKRGDDETERRVRQAGDERLDANDGERVLQ